MNLSPQTHNLLLLIAVPSSVGLESTTDVSPFLHIDALYSQIAGNGMKHPDHPRLLRKLDSNEKLEEVEAEWCLLRASKR